MKQDISSVELKVSKIEWKVSLSLLCYSDRPIHTYLYILTTVTDTKDYTIHHYIIGESRVKACVCCRSTWHWLQTWLSFSTSFYWDNRKTWTWTDCVIKEKPLLYNYKFQKIHVYNRLGFIVSLVLSQLHLLSLAVYLLTTTNSTEKLLSAVLTVIVIDSVGKYAGYPVDHRFVTR